MDCIRHYYKSIDYKPILCYVIFGNFEKGKELEILSEKYHVNEFPAGLTMQMFEKGENDKALESFIGGSIGIVLEKENPMLYEKCKNAMTWVLIRGQVQKDNTFDYMRNVIGFIQTFIDNGAYGVFDFLTFSLIEPKKWTDRFFEKQINAQNHILMLISEQKNGLYWLHTKGMAKFGRPDMSIENVSKEELQQKKQIIDQLVYYAGEGAVFEKNIKVHTRDGQKKQVYSLEMEFVNDFENADFNNAFYKVSVKP